MKLGVLTYDGVTYGLDRTAAADLLTRGVIVPSGAGTDNYYLSSDHVIDEIEDVATILDRQTGEEARGEGSDGGPLRTLALRFQHRDGEGGR